MNPKDFDKVIQNRIELANKISAAKFKLLEIAIHGLQVLKEEGNKLAFLTLEEMAKSIPRDLELDVYKNIKGTLDPPDNE